MTTSDEEWIELRRFDDAVEADVAFNFLRDHGISVSFQGNTGVGSMFNRFSTVVDIRLMVPRSEMDSAREALEAMTPDESALVADPPSSSESDASGEGPYRAKPNVPPTLIEPSFAKKYRSGPLVLACVIPGGGHFYARHNRMGIVLCVATISFWTLSIANGLPWAAAAAVLCMISDGLFGVVAVGRFNERRVPSDGRQTWLAIGMVGVAVVGGLLAASSHQPRTQRARPRIYTPRNRWD